MYISQESYVGSIGYTALSHFWDPHRSGVDGLGLVPVEIWGEVGKGAPVVGNVWNGWFVKERALGG